MHVMPYHVYVSENPVDIGAIESRGQDSEQDSAAVGECGADGRGAHGRFVAGNALGRATQFQQGNLARLKDGRRARTALRGRFSADVEAGLDEAEALIVDDLGGPDCVSRMAGSLLTRFLELEAIAAGLVQQVIEAGPVTPRGKQRAVLTSYLGVVNQLVTIAGKLGLARRTKDLAALSPQEWLARQRASQAAQDGPGTTITSSTD
jgi:hypothetical protein